jgi:signal peptidase I
MHNPDVGHPADPDDAMVRVPRAVPSLDPADAGQVAAPRAVPSLEAAAGVLPGLRVSGPDLGPNRGEAAPRAPRSGRWLVEWLAVLVVALVLAVGVRAYVAQMFYIPSGSMLPTLQVGDRIVVDKLSYRLHGVGRGDVVVFRRPPLELADYSDLVKRVIGLPGDTVAVVDGRVYIDGKRLSEPWLAAPAPITSPSPLPEGFSLNHPFAVPAGQYYVMGDNRTDSEDSRYFGPIAGKLIVGKMAFVAWPLTDAAWMAGLSVVAVVVLVLLVLALWEPRPARAPPASEGTW